MLLDEELEHKEWVKKNAVVLPMDIVIPLTTQKSSYRLPKLINSRAYERDPLPRSENNLKPNCNKMFRIIDFYYIWFVFFFSDKVREILHVTTGISDYTSRIGNLGGEIIVKELHGPVRHDFKRTEI